MIPPVQYLAELGIEIPNTKGPNMTNEQIAAKYRFIADAIDAGQSLECSEMHESPRAWRPFDPMNDKPDPGWLVRVAEPTPMTPREAWAVLNADETTHEEIAKASKIICAYTKQSLELRLAWSVFWWQDYNEEHAEIIELGQTILDNHFAEADELSPEPEAPKEPANPPYVLGWIGNNGTPIVCESVWVWKSHERADCCKGYKPFAVVSGEVVEALDAWIAIFDGTRPRVPVVNVDLYEALMKGA